MAKLIIKTGFRPITHNNVFQPQTTLKGKQLVLAQHVQDVKEIKCVDVTSHTIEAHVIRQTSVTSTPLDRGPYSAFAGKDATRGLATGEVAAADKDWDDVSDLTADEVSAAKEWEDQFKEKYDIVGRLLKPGETPTNYANEESEDKKSQ